MGRGYWGSRYWGKLTNELKGSQLVRSLVISDKCVISNSLNNN